jgi:glutaredoxin
MNEVIVYSAPWCGGCKTIKKQLEMVNIPFTEVDIMTEDGMQKAKELGIKNIPVTMINGLKYVGSSVSVIKEILKAFGGIDVKTDNTN